MNKLSCRTFTYRLIKHYKLSRFNTGYTGQKIQKLAKEFMQASHFNYELLNIQTARK